MSRRLVVPLAALVLTVAGLLAFAAWNRSRAVQRLTLTEGDLSLSWPRQNDATNDGREPRLLIAWQRRDGPLDERTWLTDDRLREIGFDLSTPAGDPRAERASRGQAPRIGWVVLEYDGPAGRDLDRRRRLRAPEPRSPLETTRLVPIDAGAARDALARRHSSDATLIMPAIFQLGYLAPEHGGPLVYGYLQRLVVSDVAVPTRFSAALAELRASRFEVDLAVGRSGFPWVTSLRRRP